MQQAAGWITSPFHVLHVPQTVPNDSCTRNADILSEQDADTALFMLNILMHGTAQPDVALLGGAHQGNLRNRVGAIFLASCVQSTAILMLCNCELSGPRWRCRFGSGLPFARLPMCL